MSGAPLATVAVCTFNRAALLDRALAALAGLQADFPWELVVVDDGSTDGSARVAAARGARVVPGPGRGIAAARNTAVAAARGEWVAFTDDDQLAEPAWLAELAATARRSGAPVVAGERRLEPTGPLPFPLPRKLRRLLGEELRGPEEGPLRGPELPNTGCVLVRRELFARLGPFDEAMTEGGEDTEFFARARAAGVALWATPRAVMRHLLGPERLAPAYLRWRAARQGAAAARIARRRRGRAGLLAGGLGWAGLAAVEAALALAAADPGERAYRLYVRGHALAYLGAAARLLRGGRAGAAGPSFREGRP